jgi:protein-ribulosamine 3-kinase
MLVKDYWRKSKMTLNTITKSKIEEKTGSKIKSVSSLSGGCISEAYRITDERENNYFLKLNPSPKDLFIKEADGLRELKKADVIKVPKVITSNEEFLLTEFISPGSRSKNFFEDFGRRFAQLHKYNAKKFGFYEDNYIGANPQINIPNEEEENDWIAFFFNKRILYQYKLAEKNGYAKKELRDGISLLEKIIHKIIGNTAEPPSLLHGDLWGGNYMVDGKGNACLIDPAVYYGNREADLAMTKLFGGFSSEFYSAYHEIYPLTEGYEYRQSVYTLYHVLNHLNLFGTSYYSHAISLIAQYK